MEKTIQNKLGYQIRYIETPGCCQAWLYDPNGNLIDACVGDYLQWCVDFFTFMHKVLK